VAAGAVAGSAGADEVVPADAAADADTNGGTLASIPESFSGRARILAAKRLSDQWHREDSQRRSIYLTFEAI
jgi:hypothetical protein